MVVNANPINRVHFVAEAPVSVLVTPNLSAEESARLLACVNAVRSGEKVFHVRLTNHKVTDGRKRLPPDDYVADPGLQPHAHEGLLVAAPINRKGRIFLHLRDEARRSGFDQDFGFTNISLDGIESFKVLGERAGPLAREERPLQGQTLDLQTLLAIQAQGMFMMGQAMIQMSQAMLSHLQPQNTPP